MMSGKSSTQNEQCDVINLQEWSGATATGRTTETRNLARDEIADASSEVRNQDRPSITGGAHVVAVPRPSVTIPRTGRRPASATSLFRNTHLRGRFVMIVNPR